MKDRQPAVHHVAPAEALDPVRRAELLALWVEATNAGGSIGFVAPVTHDDVAPTLDAALQRVADGVDDLCVIHDDADRIMAMAFLVANSTPLTAHWRTVLRVAVHPSLQGSGVGRQLMDGVHEIARNVGVEHLVLSVRDGHGLSRFYERSGYRIYGTHPGAVRVAPDDTRDEILLVIDL